MVEIISKVTREKLKNKYMTTRITIPKAVLNAAPAFKKAKKVKFEVDMLGNIILKTQ